jgi:hypothetical protein
VGGKEVKRFYYKAMRDFTGNIAWILFFISPSNMGSGAWWEASNHYDRKLSMLEHPSSGR